MLIEILKHEPSAHDRIQRWRSENQDGYIINVHSRNNAMIHHSLCIGHLGDTDWEEGRINWGSLGNTTKICNKDDSSFTTEVLPR